jgi:hypothetical protein
MKLEVRLLVRVTQDHKFHDTSSAGKVQEMLVIFVKCWLSVTHHNPCK